VIRRVLVLPPNFSSSANGNSFLYRRRCGYTHALVKRTRTTKLLAFGKTVLLRQQIRSSTALDRKWLHNAEQAVTQKWLQLTSERGRRSILRVLNQRARRGRRAVLGVLNQRARHGRRAVLGTQTKNKGAEATVEN